MTARAFAEHMWPNSPAWKRTSRRSAGAGAGAYGAGLIMSAGAFLGRLERAGLVTRHSDHWWQASWSAPGHQAPERAHQGELR